jgi:Coproporphyrinogen III oxidase and related Fe-S oxidoreductases
MNTAIDTLAPNLASIMPGVSTETLKKYDVSGPRYTSYPTADRFVEAFTQDAYMLALAQRRAIAATQPLSIYVHIPFCESLCFFCRLQQDRHQTPRTQRRVFTLFKP